LILKLFPLNLNPQLILLLLLLILLLLLLELIRKERLEK
jgi:hypothetical protein